MSRFAGHVGSWHDDRLARPRDQRARLVERQLLVGGPSVEHLGVAAGVHELNTFVVGDEKAVRRDRVGVPVQAGADLSGRRVAIGPRGGIDDRDVTHVARPAVAGREGRDDLPGARNRLGVEHGKPVELIAEENHLARAIGVGRPQVMKGKLTTVDVLPAHINHAPVTQHPGRVVVLDVRGKHPDITAVPVASVERGDGRAVAVDEAIAAAGTEEDAAIGQIGRLDVVAGTVGELPQAGAVDVDLVKVILFFASLAVGEENLFGVVMHLRVADAAFRVLEQNLQCLRADIQPAQPSAVAETRWDLLVGDALLRRIFGDGCRVTAEVRVPVVETADPHGEDNLLNA